MLISWWPATKQSKLICQLQETWHVCDITMRFLLTLTESPYLMKYYLKHMVWPSMPNTPNAQHLLMTHSPTPPPIELDLWGLARQGPACLWCSTIMLERLAGVQANLATCSHLIALWLAWGVGLPTPGNVCFQWAGLPPGTSPKYTASVPADSSHLLAGVGGCQLPNACSHCHIPSPVSAQRTLSSVVKS